MRALDDILKRMQAHQRKKSAMLRELALASDAVQKALDGAAIRTVVVRAPKLVNIVPA